MSKGAVIAWTTLLVLNVLGLIETAATGASVWSAFHTAAAMGCVLALKDES